MKKIIAYVKPSVGCEYLKKGQVLQVIDVSIVGNAIFFETSELDTDGMTIFSELKNSSHIRGNDFIRCYKNGRKHPKQDFKDLL